MGNFKGLFVRSDCLNRIAGIHHARALRLEKRGVNVLVGFKQFMHSAVWTAMTPDGVFDGVPSHLMFKVRPPRIEEIPKYQPRRVEEDTIRKIQQRYDAVHERVRATFPIGEEGHVL